MISAALGALGCIGCACTRCKQYSTGKMKVQIVSTLTTASGALVGCSLPACSSKLYVAEKHVLAETLPLCAKAVPTKLAQTQAPTTSYAN